MRKTLILLLMLLLLVTPAGAGDLSDVKDAGILRFGVSPDNYPFAFYDRNDELTGIDIKLMEAIADLMEVDLDVSDMSYESLTESLMIGQVDIIGGGFSKTESLKNKIGFSKIYYSTGSVFLSRADLTLKEPLNADSFVFSVYYEELMACLYEDDSEAGLDATTAMIAELKQVLRDFNTVMTFWDQDITADDIGFPFHNFEDRFTLVLGDNADEIVPVEEDDPLFAVFTEFFGD